MWNDEHEIRGYHEYEEGKPVGLNSYSEVERAINNDYNHVSKRFINLIEQLYGRLQIVPRRGKLSGSVALVQIPGTSYYLRARSIVHEKDNGVGTKKRGRSIATARAVWFLKWFEDLDPENQISVLNNDPNAVWNTHADKYTSRFDRSLYEIVEESVLFPMERRILGVDKQKAQSDT